MPYSDGGICCRMCLDVLCLGRNRTSWQPVAACLARELLRLGWQPDGAWPSPEHIREVITMPADTWASWLQARYPQVVLLPRGWNLASKAFDQYCKAHRQELLIWIHES